MIGWPDTLESGRPARDTPNVATARPIVLDQRIDDDLLLDEHLRVTTRDQVRSVHRSPAVWFLR